jgi:N-acetylmuramoyl-L-alanine amidase
MGRILSRKEWRRRRRIKNTILMTTAIVLLLIILALSALLVSSIVKNMIGSNQTGRETLTQSLNNGEEIQVHYITPNTYSRPQTELKRVKNIVIHYTANPGTSAENNRSYFQGLATKHSTYASSHYIIGIEGEIIQCIPLTEIAYASNDRNNDTISIESCHPDETGEFSTETYSSLVSLTAALCIEYGLDEKDIIRHYDVSGKLCPLYFVQDEEAWKTFKEDVRIVIDSLQLVQDAK